MNESTPQLGESGLPEEKGRGEEQFASADIYLTRGPTQATPEETVVEWRDDAYDARIRSARMLYPYEYWDQPTQESNYRRAFISPVSGDDIPPMPDHQPPAGFLPAVAGFFWLVASRVVRASGKGLSSLARRRLPD